MKPAIAPETEQVVHRSKNSTAKPGTKMPIQTAGQHQWARSINKRSANNSACTGQSAKNSLVKTPTRKLKSTTRTSAKTIPDPKGQAASRSIKQAGQTVQRALRRIAQFLQTPFGKWVGRKVGEAVLEHCAKAALCLIVPALF